MGRTRRFALKLVTGIVGFPLLLGGIVLIPLPGPGVLTCLLALFVLSLGYDWPKPYFDKFKLVIRKILADARKRARDFDEAHKD